MTEYEWEQVCSLWGMRRTADEKAAGCPDAFEPHHLAIMQRPTTKAAPDRSETVQRQRALLCRMQEAIDAGTLPTIEGHRLEPIYEKKFTPRKRSALGCEAWSAEFSAHHGVWQDVKVGERSKAVRLIERAAFRGWLAGRGEKESEHISAWLRPLEQTEACQKSESNIPARQEPPKKPETQAERVEHALQECERIAPKIDRTFDRWNMPGQKKQFEEFLRKLDPAFSTLKPSTLRDYVDGARCKWDPKRAKQNPDATRFYDAVLSNLRAHPGVIPALRCMA